MSPARSAVCLGSFLAIAVLSGCGSSTDAACTLIGCTDQFVVTVEGPAGAEFVVQASEPGGDTRTETCTVTNDSCAIVFDNFAPDQITLRVTGPERELSVTLQPAYEALRPNGPGCPPTCLRASVTVDLRPEA
jgi:hypothetical protein